MAIVHVEEDERRGAIILAGGDSKRLGRPKALLDICGIPLIALVAGRLSAFFNELTVVTDRSDLDCRVPVRFCSDLLLHREKSPLRGIHAGLSSSDLPYQFVAACDMPFISIILVRYMARYAEDYDAVVPRIGSYYQPLHAYYSRSCIAVIDKHLKEGSYKITDFYAGLKVKYIGEAEISSIDPGHGSFININTWADYESALKIYGRPDEVARDRKRGS